MKFSHLHCHTQFSLLDGAANIKDMLKKASDDGMPACAITDHGNMFGVFQFVNEANNRNIKPIIGCEFYIVDDRFKKSFTKPDKDVRYHQVLLAKNAEGYKNLSKLCSLGWIEGKYGNYPRIDKTLIEKYHKGLIATTCCLAAEVPRTLLRKGEDEAEKILQWWLNLFGEDYYIELQKHDIAEQNKINPILIKWAKKYNIKTICTNDSHYTEQKDYTAHDILLCINTGAKQSDPTNKDFSDDDDAQPSGVKRRFAFANDQFYFKTTSEMQMLFEEVPEALDNTNEIVDKVEKISLKRDILLPAFPLEKKFQIHDDPNLNQWEYLKHITYEGAKKRYHQISVQVQERLDFELFTIKTMGFAGYFLIVSDFISSGREMGVFIGPGRGSAAGSCVAYCIGITNIDPIKYNLLFERFLNPDRKSMPDIDTDFDDEGRQKVIDYVVEKYGKNQVAQIVTYGTMAAKMSIKDVSRVMDLPLDESNYLAKLVPDKPGISLKRIFHAPLYGSEAEKLRKEYLDKHVKNNDLTPEQKEKALKKAEDIKSLAENEGINNEEIESVKKIREIYQSESIKGKILKQAEILEGSVRGTGVHAAGIIIAPSDLTELMPLATAKDTNALLTQYEGGVIESAGVIKMDFLGLKTLTIIKNTLLLIKKNHKIEVDIDKIDLTDEHTFALFKKGETNGIFQFENPGLQKFLIEMKPDKLEDLIAMTALYRPGPIDYIPTYIKRKLGIEQVVYDLPDMQEHLEETYGITVYQEQVMLLSQKLAGFSKGDADVLRKAIGKKNKADIDKMKSKFIQGAVKNNHPEKILEKIWNDWEQFASYAFNKSHATCYAYVAFQMAWLKTHYPAEFLAANLTNEKDNIDKVTFFMEEAKKMNIKVLGPDINESSPEFDVNIQGEIRFGLGAIKGAGEAAVNEIIAVRDKSGHFKDVFDFASKVNLRTVNKKTFESLAQAGAFDYYTDMHRAMYFHKEEGEQFNYIEKIIKFGQTFQEEKFSSQNTLFGNMSNTVALSYPKLPNCDPWGEIEKLRLEKEVVGFYISGHPLDQYKLDIDKFCTCGVADIFSHKNKEIHIAGVITSAINGQSAKSGKPYGRYKIEDYNSSHEFFLFGDDVAKFGHILTARQFVYMRVKVLQRYNQIDQWEIKLQSVELLSELRDKKAKCIKLILEPHKLTSKMIDKLEELAIQHKGSCDLNIYIAHNGLSVELYSRKYKVAPGNDFFHMMQDLLGYDNVKLN
ncbi:MAG: DNA polymerase III subunit alpha [Cytophagales bacterium]|nr:DNA polymerase III subunit alpha [Cytophagales bacterium]